MANVARTVANFNITTAGTQVSDAFKLAPGIEHLTLWMAFDRGSSGGTSAKFYLQTTLDGTNWFDIACFAFTTTTANRALSILREKQATPVTPTDGTLTDNTQVGGLFGQSYRVKCVSVGTYVGPATGALSVFEGD